MEKCVYWYFVQKKLTNYSTVKAHKYSQKIEKFKILCLANLLGFLYKSDIFTYFLLYIKILSFLSYIILLWKYNALIIIVPIFSLILFEFIRIYIICKFYRFNLYFCKKKNLTLFVLFMSSLRVTAVWCLCF